MPLSGAVQREMLHERAIQLRGYRRTDGLFDVEAHLTDIKAYGFDNADRGHVPAGVPLHDMWARVTINEDMDIVAAEATTDQGPYTICPGGATSFATLVGLRIGPGFLKAARTRLGGTVGCTHLRELLQQIATTAMQSTFPVRARRAMTDPDADAKRMMNSCFAYASDGANVRRRWPHLYTGPLETASD